MMRSLVAAVLALSALILSEPAGAAVVYSENFNNAGFQSSPLVLGNLSDRWTNTDYYYINNFDGWSFTGGAFYALNHGTTDGAVLLNENGSTSASTTVAGLTPGQGYTLSFLQWGDNIFDSAYVGKVTIDGSLALTYSGVDGAAGTNPGFTRTVNFTAASSSASLLFEQASTTSASPIIDDVTVSTFSAVPEPTSLAFLGVGLLATLGIARKSRQERCPPTSL